MSLATDILGKVDALDAKAFASYFAPDGRVVFGNGDALVGRDTVEAGTAGFFDTIAGLSHRIDNEWTVGQDTIVELAVTYDRKDGGQVTVPVVSIWTLDGDGMIAHYRVFFDLAPVFS